MAWHGLRGRGRARWLVRGDDGVGVAFARACVRGVGGMRGIALPHGCILLCAATLACHRPTPPLRGLLNILPCRHLTLPACHCAPLRAAIYHRGSFGSCSCLPLLRAFACTRTRTLRGVRAAAWRVRCVARATPGGLLLPLLATLPLPHALPFCTQPYLHAPCVLYRTFYRCFPFRLLP